MQLRTHDRVTLDSIERRTRAKSPTDLRALYICDDTTKSLDRLRKMGLVALNGANYVLTTAGRVAHRAQSPDAIAAAYEANKLAAERRAGYQNTLRKKLAAKRDAERPARVKRPRKSDEINPLA